MIESHETLIHGCEPILIVPLVFTVYPARHVIADPAHLRLSQEHPDYDWFLIGEVDVPLKEGRLSVFEGSYWAMHIKDMGDDYQEMLAALRAHAFEFITALFPLAVFDEE